MSTGEGICASVTGLTIFCGNESYLSQKGVNTDSARMRTIKGSIALSMCINLGAVICSVLGLLTPTTGAIVHNAGSCLVILIAALLYDRKFEETS